MRSRAWRRTQRLARAILLGAFSAVVASATALAQSNPPPPFCPPSQLSSTGNCCPSGQTPQSDGSCATPAPPPPPAVQCQANQVSVGNFCTSCLAGQVASGNACVTPAANQCGGAPTVTIAGYVLCCPAGDNASGSQCANNPYTTDSPLGCATSQITTAGTCCPAGESPTAAGSCCPSGQLTGANTCCPSGTTPQADNTCKPGTPAATPCPAGVAQRSDGSCQWPAACPVAQLTNTGTCCPSGQAGDINGHCVTPPTSCPSGQVISNNQCICPYPQLTQPNGTCFAGCPAGATLTSSSGYYTCVAPQCPSNQSARSNPDGGYTCVCNSNGQPPVNGGCGPPASPPPPQCQNGLVPQGNTCVCPIPGQVVQQNGTCGPPPTQQQVKCPGNQTWNGTTCVCPAGFDMQPGGNCVAHYLVQPQQTCPAGTVPRGAFTGDIICVLPWVREQVQTDNNSQAGRVRPGGGCMPGYVWREAGPSDHVCVLPSTRTQAGSDNAHGSRATSSLPRGPAQIPTQTQTPPHTPANRTPCGDRHCNSTTTAPTHTTTHVWHRPSTSVRTRVVTTPRRSQSQSRWHMPTVRSGNTRR